MLHKTKACFNYFSSFRMYLSKKIKKYVSRTKFLYLPKSKCIELKHIVLDGLLTLVHAMRGFLWMGAIIFSKCS